MTGWKCVKTWCLKVGRPERTRFRHLSNSQMKWGQFWNKLFISHEKDTRQHSEGALEDSGIVAMPLSRIRSKPTLFNYFPAWDDECFSYKHSEKLESRSSANIVAFHRFAGSGQYRKPRVEDKRVCFSNECFRGCLKEFLKNWPPPPMKRLYVIRQNITKSTPYSPPRDHKNLRFEQTDPIFWSRPSKTEPWLSQEQD